VPSLLEPVVCLRDVWVRYDRTPALQGVSFEVEPGRVLAVVGPNGAGKSTLFRAMLGLVPLDAGEARVLGLPPGELPPAERARIAYVPETHPELGHARVADTLAFRRRLYPGFDDRTFAELTAAAAVRPSMRVGELSRGQRALFVVGLALAQAPSLLLLDDPTLGLDPLARRRVIQAVLAATRERSLTAIVATHEIADVERLADDILLLPRGRATCQVEEIAAFVDRSWSVCVPLDAPRDEIESLDAVLHVWPRRDHLEVILSDEPAQRCATQRTLALLTGAFDALEPRPVSLEELTLAWLAREHDRSPHV